MGKIDAQARGQIPSSMSSIFLKPCVEGSIVFQHAKNDVDEFPHCGANDEHFAFPRGGQTRFELDQHRVVPECAEKVNAPRGSVLVRREGQFSRREGQFSHRCIRRERDRKAIPPMPFGSEPNGIGSRD
jgi:hypothetical protein